MNIILDGHSLQFLGGMERVVCDLASELSRRGHRVFLFTSDPQGATPIFALHEDIRIVHSAHGGRRRYIAAFRQQIVACSPDVCISAATDRRHWPWCAALRDTGIPLILSEHNAPGAVEHILWNREERLAAMAGADMVHMLLPSYAASVPSALRERVRVIPNAVTLPVLPREAHEAPVILGMGRLSWEKQNSLLLEAFALLAEEFPQWQLHLWGKGPERGRLEALIARLGMQERAFLPGGTATPQCCYAQADMVCLPSLYEGFPGVVVEAMAAGLPVVGFAQCPGTHELVRHGVTGLLAPDMAASSLAQALRPLMADAALRRTQGEKAAELAQAYAPAVVYDIWERVLQEAALAKGHTRMQTLERVTSDASPWHEWAAVFRHCTERSNVLVGDDQHLRRIIFQFPWLKRALHPLYTWIKSLRRVKRQA